MWAGLGVNVAIGSDTTPQRSASALEVRKQLGSGFTETVMQLEPGTWQGPIWSGFGVHLVYVYEHLEAPVPALEDVRDVVLEGWQTEKIASFNEEFYESLKSRYDIVIENPDLGADGVLQMEQTIEDGRTGSAESES